MMRPKHESPVLKARAEQARGELGAGGGEPAARGRQQLVPSRSSKMEARRLLQSTTALANSPTMPIYSGARRTRAISPISSSDTARLTRRPVDLPSARSIDVAGGGSRQRGKKGSPEKGGGRSEEEEETRGKNAWFAPKVQAANALPEIVAVYEAQVEALIDVATRFKMQVARQRSALDPALSPPGAFSEASIHARGDPSIGKLHTDAAHILAELRVTVLKMVQALQISQLAHERRQRAMFEYSEPPDSALKAKRLNELVALDPTVLLSRYDLKYIEQSPASNARPRSSKTLWQGLNYVLKAVTDFWRLPLPTSSDPFTLHWFEPFAHSPDTYSVLFEPSRWHSPETLEEFRRADAFIKRGMLGTNRCIMLNSQELGLPHGVGKEWHAVAALLYGSTKTFVLRKRYTDERNKAATTLAMAWRKLILRRRVRRRHDEKLYAAAARIQEWWRRQAVAASQDPWLSSLSVPERRELRRQRQARQARVKLVARRRAALKISLARYPEYVRKIKTVQSLARIQFARRVCDKLRKRKLGFTRTLSEHAARVRASAIKWQRQIRRWEEASDLMWSEYRRVVNQVSGYAPASSGEEVEAACSTLRAALEHELGALREAYERIPSSVEANYYRLLAGIAHNRGVIAALQGAVDEFVVFTADEPTGTYHPPKNAVAGDNPPRAWLRRRLEELTKAEELAPQYTLGARHRPFSKTVLQHVADEAHDRLCKQRYLMGARKLATRLVGRRDRLGEAARVRADEASASTLGALAEAFPPDDNDLFPALASRIHLAQSDVVATAAAEAAAAAEHDDGSPRRASLRAGYSRPLPPSTLDDESSVQHGEPWACQLLIGLYGHLGDCIERVERDGADAMPLADVLALVVAHEERRGGHEVVQEMVSEFGMRSSKYTPKVIIGRVRDEIESKLADLESIRPQLKPAATKFTDARRLHERINSVEGALKVLTVIDEALARERWQMLQQRRISLVGQLAASTRIKPAYKTAVSQLAWQRGALDVLRELREKTHYPPSYVELRCELVGPGFKEELAVSEVYDAFATHVVGDIANYIGCEDDQLVIETDGGTVDGSNRGGGGGGGRGGGGDVSRRSSGSGRAAVLRLLIINTESERLGHPKEVVEALKEAIHQMGRDFTLPGVASALGVREEVPSIGISALEIPEYTPLNVLRTLKELGAEARSALEEAEAKMELVRDEKARRFKAHWGRAAERRRVPDRQLEGPLRPHKERYDYARGREHVLSRLDRECPPREEARRARLWLPAAIDTLEAELLESCAHADETVQRYTALYADRRPIKVAMRQASTELNELKAKLPKYVLAGLTVRVPEPREEDGWVTRESYLAEKRLVLRVAREAARMNADAAGFGPAEGEEDEGETARAWAAVKACMQMSARPSLLDKSARITPEMVVAMASRLGISLVRADDELFLLPLAVEAITCPLPAGWVEEAAAPDAPPPEGVDAELSTAGLGGFSFRHLVTGELRAEHPLLSTFAEHVAQQRRRKKRPRKWGHLEGWMQFATAEDGTEYVDLAADGGIHRQSELPLIEAPSILARRAASDRERAAAAFVAGESKASRQRDIIFLVAEQLEKERLATREVHEHAARTQAAESLSGLYRRVRARALRMRPCALPEIFVASGALEIEPMKQPELVWLAEMLLGCPSTFFPAGWLEWEDQNPMTGETKTYYANEVSKLEEERAAHPYRVEVRTVQAIVRAMQRELLDADTDYQETFEFNQLLESVKQRRAAALTISAEELALMDGKSDDEGLSFRGSYIQQIPASSVPASSKQQR